MLYPLRTRLKAMLAETVEPCRRKALEECIALIDDILKEEEL